MIDNVVARNLTLRLIKGLASNDTTLIKTAKDRLQKLSSETYDSKLKLEIYFTLKGLCGTED